MNGRDTASLDTCAVAKAANNNVDNLNEVIRSLDKKAQGEFSLRLRLAARSSEQLRDIVPAVHRVFVCFTFRWTDTQHWVEENFTIVIA